MKTCVFALLFVLLAPLSFAQQSAPDIPFDSVPDFLKLDPSSNGTNISEKPSLTVPLTRA